MHFSVSLDVDFSIFDLKCFAESIWKKVKISLESQSLGTSVSLEVVMKSQRFCCEVEKMDSYLKNYIEIL